MKKVLIVHAHEESKSFCSSLCKEAVKHFESLGYEIQVSDLYAMNFNPVGGKSDFIQKEEPDFFKYQMEQVKAFQESRFESNLKAEMEKLEACDILIFNFPIWWFGLPAILKGWVDRVFAMGFAYGGGKGVYDNGVFKNKTAFLCLTTGGPEIAYGENGKNGDLNQILYPINHGMLYFTGMKVIEPFVSFSPARKTKEELEMELKRYRSFLEGIDEKLPIF